MRTPLARILVLLVALVAGVAVAGLALLSLPWVKPRGGAAPHVEVIARGSGPLSAGVGVAPIDVPLGAPIAGFAHLSYRSTGSEPVTARALVLSSGDLRVAVVSAEILLVPDALRAAVLARLQGLQLSGVVLVATHTHASLGGYYENIAAERAGLGPYDPALRDLVANAMAEAVRRALATSGPARLSVGRGRDPRLVRGRDGAEPDGRLTVLRLDRPTGQPLAELTAFGCHATVLGIHNRRIDGDWPAQFYARSKHGVRLLLQAAVGDQSVAMPGALGPVTPQAYGEAVDRAVSALSFAPPDPAPEVDYAAAEVVLPVPAPPMVPRPLRQAATNLAANVLPTQARVSALRLGPVLLLFTPGEVMASAAGRWREMTGGDAEVVSLADGYVGYIDEAERSAGQVRRVERAYYGAGLSAALEQGLSLVVGAVHEAARPAAGEGTGAGEVKAPAASAQGRSPATGK